MKVQEKRNFLDRWMDGIERVGNKLPDPVTLFILLTLIVVVVSGICSLTNVQAVHPGTGETITAVNLFSVAGIQYFWKSAVSNFSGFAPLGMVLVAVIGSAAAEKSGFLVALMSRFLGKSKGWIVTAVIVFVGINANIAGDAGFIVMPPLAAIIYMSIGRHPLLGLFVAFASVAAGFCANILLGLSDALAYGYTEAAAQMIDPTYVTSPAINWYFLIVSCFVLTIAGTILTEKLMVHRFPADKALLSTFDFDESSVNLTPAQHKGLRLAGISFLVFVAVLVVMCVGPTPILGNEEGSITASNSPFMAGIIITVSIALLVPGVAYGIGSGKYHNDKDVWADITTGFREMGQYIFMCFFIAQFTNFFSTSKLGIILAIKGAELLKAIGFAGVPLMIGLIFVTCIVNLFIGSASAKWAILAPIFVPMMMLMGYDPAVTQIAYRIGDSITNPLSPLFTYIPIAIGFARKYDKNAGMGTVIANMVPYSITFCVIWVIQLALWVAFNLPLGPGGGIYLS